MTRIEDMMRAAKCHILKKVSARLMVLAERLVRIACSMADEIEQTYDDAGMGW